MKCARLIFFLLLFSITCVKVWGQDPVFSQFYSASMFLNPALAADKQNTNFTLQHRTYTNIYSVYNLSQITGVVPLKIKALDILNSDHQSGAALTIYRVGAGKNGELVTLGVLGTFAHNIQVLKSHYVSLGLQAGYVNIKQGNNFKWGTQYDEYEGYDKTIIPSIGEIKLASQFPTINAGAVWFMNNSSMKNFLQRYRFDAFAGISAFNINRPNISFFNDEKSRLPVNWKIHGGIKTKISSKISLFPNMMYVRQNKDNQFVFGSYFIFKPKEFDDELAYNAIFGLWYSAGESIIASIGSSYYNIKFAVSYDFLATNKFTMAGVGKGAFEASLRYTLPTKKEQLSRGHVYPSF